MSIVYVAVPLYVSTSLVSSCVGSFSVFKSSCWSGILLFYQRFLSVSSWFGVVQLAVVLRGFSDGWVNK